VSRAIALEVNGVTVEPPEGYVAEAIDLTGGYTAAIGIRPPAAGPALAGYMGNNYVCALTYRAFSADIPTAPLTQAEHNAHTLDPANISFETEISGMVKPVAETATVRDIAWLELGGPVAGVDVVAMVTFKASSPAGLVTLMCSTTTADFAAALPALRQIRDSIVLPAAP
jgi:hypothetical protein